MPFWDNFDQRLLEWSTEWPPPDPLPPTWRTWVRSQPTATFDDPWVDAARSLIVLDVGSWPAGSRPHMYLDPPYIAPSLDLYASFQYPGVTSDWLLLDAHSPVAHGGLLSWTGQGVVAGAPAHRQRRRPGGVPAHVGDVLRGRARGVAVELEIGPDRWGCVAKL